MYVYLILNLPFNLAIPKPVCKKRNNQIITSVIKIWHEVYTLKAFDKNKIFIFSTYILSLMSIFSNIELG